MTDPGRAYRTSVVPFSIFLMLGGGFFAFLMGGMRVPITSPFPFIVSDALNRFIFVVVGLVCVAIGIGLIFRSRVAWYALLVFLVIGVVLPVISVLDARILQMTGFKYPIFGVLLNGAIGIGIYFAMRPAFSHD